MAKQLRIAVVGKTGNGKSSVANSIIGEHVFKTGVSANRVTKVTSSRTKRLSSGYDTEVFDTPGLYQEGEDESEIRKEIEKSIVSPGLHAVVFVIKIGRFTKEEQEAVEEMKILFGTSIFRLTIFAFTCINDLGIQSLEGFVDKSAPVYLKDIIRESGSRIVGFDNRDKTKDKHYGKTIISMVAEMSQKHKECLYSRELFEEAFEAKMERKKEEQEKKEIDRKLEFEIETAEKEATLKKKHEDDRNTIAKRQDQITSEQEQYLQETAEKERLSIERVNSESLKEIEEKFKSGTNDLIADMNLKTEVALDTKPETKTPRPVSSDLQHFKGENQPTSVWDTESETALKESGERRTPNITIEQGSNKIPPNELRLGITGKSGNDKSSTANTIIGKDIFGATATSKTTKETTKAMLEKETKASEALLIQQPEDSKRARKDITDKIEDQMRGIKNDNAKKEITALKSKDWFENEGESKQKEHEQNMEKQKELDERLHEEQKKRQTVELQLQTLKEAIRTKKNEKPIWKTVLDDICTYVVPNNTGRGTQDQGYSGHF